MARHLTTQRHRALDILFEAEVKGILVPGLLRELLEQRRRVSTSQVPIQDAGARLVELVADHLYELDETIDSLSKWGLRRLAFLDRNILRLGIAEVRYTGAELAEVILEYTNLVRDLGGEKSIPFITAILNRAAETGGPDSGTAGGETEDRGDDPRNGETVSETPAEVSGEPATMVGDSSASVSDREHTDEE